MAARALSRSALCTLASAAVLVSAAPAAALAEGPTSTDAAEGDAATDAVGIVVLRENGTGSASRAQSYLDILFAGIAATNGWSSVEGKYFTDRGKAVKYIEETRPSFGFVGIASYLALRKAHGMTPMARADALASGGGQYFVVSKNQVVLEGCKGKTLASNHIGDARFIDQVVSGDDFDLTDFTVVPTRRPVQTLKAVIEGEAECALVDDAQIAALGSVDGGASLRLLWSSARMPSVVIVSLGTATPEQVKAFSASVGTICEGDGREACDAAGLEAPTTVAADAFADLQAAYDG